MTTWLSSGCAQRLSRIEIVDRTVDGRPERFHETFQEAYYAIDGTGNIDVVLRRCDGATSRSGTRTHQVIHLRTVWKTVPGRTVAERSQINATIRYSIYGDCTASRFEGVGSLFLRENRRRGTLDGAVDLAWLRSTHGSVADGGFFRNPRLSGTFHATRDERRATRIIHDADRHFDQAAGETVSQR